MDSTLSTLGRKLGITSAPTYRKAEELVRLLGVQGASQLCLSASAKAVICLDVAATITGTTIDKVQVVKLSGLKRAQYVALSQTVSRLLNQSPQVTITDLCITHSATQATDLAKRVLKHYDAEVKADVDTSLPMYQVAAVLAATKVLKIKVDKRRLFESSGSKRTVLQKLEESMTKIANDLHTKKGAKVGTKRSRTLMDMVEDKLQESQEKCSRSENKNTANGKEETNGDDDFELWKKKILEAASTAAD